MIIGSWGEFILQSDRLISSLNGNFPFEFIEKPKLDGFPSLQSAGDSLSKHTVSFELNQEFIGDPLNEFINWLNAAKLKQTKTLTIANFTIGLCVITNIRYSVSLHNLKSSSIGEISMTVDFKENPLM